LVQIVVNGEPTKTAAQTLAELCAALGFSGTKVATAVNGDFVANHKRDDMRLAENDSVEIVTPRQGG
jgi:sulfur carrier protein